MVAILGRAVAVLLLQDIMTVTTPLLETIEPDESVQDLSKTAEQSRPAVVLTPTNHAQGSGPMATTQSDAEAGEQALGSFPRPTESQALSQA